MKEILDLYDFKDILMMSRRHRMTYDLRGYAIIINDFPYSIRFDFSENGIWTPIYTNEELLEYV